ncbi:hypothetical protein J5T34_19235 [Cupriavidus gilardii]|uniref:hypothetical protein n=1 Tax=Cupriavidus gilardii TaxID=82541 RepID=UPI001ABDD6DB|nr:hypothetical protein [Cupriavidus gilardii]MBO4122863.1 hypothetical protein [Cupriavidus gilardii]
MQASIPLYTSADAGLLAMNATSAHADPSSHNHRHAGEPGRLRPFRRGHGDITRQELLELLRQSERPPQRGCRDASFWQVAGGVGAALAVLLSAMNFMNAVTQDRFDRAFASMHAELAELDKRTSERLDSIDKRMSDQFAAMRTLMDVRFDGVEARVKSLDERVASLEARLGATRAHR